MRAFIAFAILIAAAPRIGAQPAAEPLTESLRALKPDTRTYAVDAAGMTRSGRRMASLEPVAAPLRTQRRVVLVGGLDGSPHGAAAVVAIVKWFLTERAAAPARSRWQIAAVPCVYVDRCGGGDGPPMTMVIPNPSFPPDGGFFDDEQEPESRFLWRWVAMQAPDLVIDVRLGDAQAWSANGAATGLMPGARATNADSLATALGAERAAGLGAVATLQLEAGPSLMATAVEGLLLKLTVSESPLRRAIAARITRPPLEIARAMAARYPAQPIMSYIPALSWSGALRLAQRTQDNAVDDKAVAELTPFLDGRTPAIAEPYQLTSLAGHLALAELAARGDANASALVRKAADFILPEDPGAVVRFPRAWTDDMFMASSIWARAAALTGDARYGAATGRLLTTYAATLQQPSGLFVHAKEGPFAWGRGNGFAAFGMVEALTALGAGWSERPRVIQSYRALMQGLRAQQAPDGMWRQVVDEPGSYREFTVTAMTIAAMARGVRLGWLDAAYRPVVERAWRGLLGRIAEDGTLLDVCTGTGSGPTKQYYLDRAAISGADDRGGAMAMTAALEIAELSR